jgi:hypothetical protein
MVPNQRQLFIVVSDWGSHLGSHFPTGFCGIMFFVLMPVSSTERHVLLLFIVFVSFNELNVELYVHSTSFFPSSTATELGRMPVSLW